MRKIKILFWLVLFSIQLNAQSNNINVSTKTRIEVPEPSDIAILPSGRLIVVSDQGFVYEIDANGKRLKKSSTSGADLEGICYHDGKLFVSEESFRKVLVYDTTDLKQLAVYEYEYFAGRNDGMESISYNTLKSKFIVVSEKNPCALYELDNNYKPIQTISLPKQINEISSAVYHNNFIWLLSDEQRTIFKLNPNDYSLVQSWMINVTNAEGLAFDKDGNAIVVSDDRAMMFKLKLN